MQVARTLASVNTEPVRRADEPVYRGVELGVVVRRRPVHVRESDKIALLAEWSGRLLAADGVDHVDATCRADPGEQVLRRPGRHVDHPAAGPAAAAGSGAAGGPGSRRGSRRCARSPRRSAAAGSTCTGTGWDWDAEIDRAARAAGREDQGAVACEPGRYDLVIDPSNLWLTIHESVGHATELDRALGYEAAYAGTVVRDPRPARHAALRQRRSCTSPATGRSSTGWPPSATTTTGVAGSDLGPDPRRRPGRLPARPAYRAALRGLGRSNGCAFADSPQHVPIQRMANVSLQPAGARTVDRRADRRGRTASTSSATSPGRSTCSATTSSSPGSGSTGSEHGRLAGQLRDVAYQATTTDFWGSMAAVGGPVDLRARRRDELRQGASPAQVAAVSHGCPSRCSTASTS